MTAPTITTLPDAPQRSDAPATFVTKADALLAAQAEFVSDTNAVAVYFDATVAAVELLVASAGFSATSTTSLAVGTGSKSLTIQTGRSFVVGSKVVIAETAAPQTNYMAGSVTAYNSGTGALVVTVDTIAGSGTIAAWTVSLTGPTGPLPTKATAAEIRDGDEDTHYITAKGLMDASDFVASSITGSVTPDFSTGLNFAWTLTGNVTLAVPTNMENGQSGVINFIQDGTGGRTLSLNASIKKPGGTAPTLSTAAGAIDRCGYIVRGGVLELTALEKGFA